MTTSNPFPRPASLSHPIAVACLSPVVLFASGCAASKPQEPPRLDRGMSAIADYAGELSTKLEDMAARYPTLIVKAQFLPEVEVKTRELLASEAQDTFLSESGKEFEREFLLEQRSGLEQEQHIAKVMVAIETADERRNVLAPGRDALRRAARRRRRAPAAELFPRLGPIRRASYSLAALA